jgi:hypothetical protein
MQFRFPFAQYPLLDAHCHGVVTHDLADTEFEALASESRLLARPSWSPLDSPVGLAIRRWCAPVLDLPEHAPTAEYPRRRPRVGVSGGQPPADPRRRSALHAGRHRVR